MAEANTTEAMVAGSDDEASNFTHDGEHAASDNDEPSSLYEIRSMLVEIQITVSGIQRQNNQLVEEMVTLRNTVKSQKRELDHRTPKHNIRILLKMAFQNMTLYGISKRTF